MHFQALFAVALGIAALVLRIVSYPLEKRLDEALWSALAFLAVAIAIGWFLYAWPH